MGKLVILITFLFLMHRVELKASLARRRLLPFSVPNAPCGVESRQYASDNLHNYKVVPNAPCGVERRALEFNRYLSFGS